MPAQVKIAGTDVSTQIRDGQVSLNLVRAGRSTASFLMDVPLGGIVPSRRQRR